MAELAAEYREKLIDQVVELDDDVMMAYLDVRGGGRRPLPPPPPAPPPPPPADSTHPHPHPTRAGRVAG